MSGLVLSLFPGIGLLDRGFEDEGFTVVRGPDLLWGGDVHRFHPPAGRFDGVIGGPPCQRFSPIGNVNRARWGDGSVLPDLIPEFRRVVLEAEPSWYVMENSPRAYAPFPGTRAYHLNTAWLGERQDRRRCFWSNLNLYLSTPALVPPEAGSERAVSKCGSVDWKGSRAKEAPRSVEVMAELQGLPRDFFADAPFTIQALKKAIGNGVPYPMARAVAAAVKRAISEKREESVA